MTEFKKWEDYSDLEQAATLYSDYFKDVNGCRPRFDQSSWTVEDYDRAMDSLAEEMEEIMKFDVTRREEAIVAFEKLLEETCVTCGCSKREAVKYLKDAEGDDWHDEEHYEYDNHLPFGYIKKAVA